jgi:hypothetical protein
MIVLRIAVAVVAVAFALLAARNALVATHAKRRAGDDDEDVEAIVRRVEHALQALRRSAR